MQINRYTNGHFTRGPLRRIDSGSLSVLELTEALDLLVATNNVLQRCQPFVCLVRLLDVVTKVNPHQHITGSIGDRELLRRVAQIYQRDPTARTAFLDYVASQRMVKKGALRRFFRQYPDDLLGWFETHIPLPGDPEDFREADDRLALVRLAFQSEAPDSLELMREAYRTVALENAAHGVTEVWFRTSLGDHESGSFLEAARAALDGTGEIGAGPTTATDVRFLVGMRKHAPEGKTRPPTTTDSRAEDLVAAVAGLRDGMPKAREMFIGIDSVGMDSHWRPEWQAAARSLAVQHQLHVAVHFGESWQPGELLTTLGMLSELVNDGVVHQLDNANALFAVKDLLSPYQKYSNDQWAEIRRLQVLIFEALVRRRISLGINPTSNDLLTRSLRRKEGWRFRTLTEPLGVGRPSVADLMLGGNNTRRPMVIVVGNDNSRLYPSRVPGAFLTVSEELANLWDVPGSTFFSVYGKLPTEVVAQLIHNGFFLARSVVSGGLNSLLRPHAIVAKLHQTQGMGVFQYPHANYSPADRTSILPLDSMYYPGGPPTLNGLEGPLG